MCMNIRLLFVISSLMFVGTIAVAADPSAPSVYDSIPDSGAIDPALPPLPVPVNGAMESSSPVEPLPAGEFIGENATSRVRIVGTSGAAIGVCPYCGDPNCRRSSRQATCRERIAIGFHEHFGHGIPGHRLSPQPPTGSRLHTIMGWQRANGQAALQVLHDYDFQPGSARLNVRGRRELLEIAIRAARNPYPIIIQSIPGRPELERRRWETVVEVLSHLEMPIAPARVIVARPPARPLQGDEILRAYGSLVITPGSPLGPPPGGSLPVSPIGP